MNHNHRWRGHRNLDHGVCLIIAWVIVRSKFKGRAVLDGLTFLPHAIPGVTIGIALIYLYLNPPLNICRFTARSGSSCWV